MDNKRQLAVVIGLIRNSQGKIFLQKRLDPLIPAAHDKWEFPGGRIDYGESPEEALKRECLEEMGCVVEVGKLIPTVQSTVWSRSDDKEQHVLVFCYEAELISGEPQSSDVKVGEMHWFNENEIEALDTLLGIEDFLNISKGL